MVRYILFILGIGFGFLSSPLRAQMLDTVCAGARGESYRVNSTPGSSYRWFIQGGFITSGQGTAEVKVNWGQDTGIKKIKVLESTSIGCPGDTVYAEVLIRQGIKIEVQGPSTLCKGETITLAANGASRYRWNTGHQTAGISIQPEYSFTYSVVGYSDLCGIDTAHFEVKVFDKPRAQFIINPNDPELNRETEFIYTGKANGTIMWEIPEKQEPAFGKSVTHTFTRSGNYEVTLIVIDTNGCADTSKKAFELHIPVHVYIPNVFTPNGDRHNPVFKPETWDILSSSMIIYSRWGEKIFEGADDHIAWDGTWKGEAVPEGVYVYQISVKGLDGKKYFYEGTVQLLR